MPNYLEIGEVGLALGRELAPKIAEEASAVLTREVTAILERGTFLSNDALPGLSRFLSNTAAGELPTISRTLGIAGREEGGTLIVGRPYQSVASRGGEVVVYEPHRNVTIRPDGSINVASPTPSGQRIMTRNFNWKGPYVEESTRLNYVDNIEHSYPAIPNLQRPGGNMLANVITRGESRQFSVGTWGWMHGRQNFMPAQALIDAIEATKPVNVSSEIVNRVLGSRVSTPQASGWLLGFDKNAGEAIVSHDFPLAGFDRWRPTNAVVKSLDGLYPIELKASRGPNVTAYRNAVGQIFRAEEVPAGIKLSPTDNLVAYKPSEVTISYPYTPLASALEVDSSTGLRALGGYHTGVGDVIPGLGGRIPIRLPGQ